MTRRLIVAATLFACWVYVGLAAGPAQAHDRGTSYSTWTINEAAVHVSVRLTEVDLSRYPWGVRGGPLRESTLGSYLPEHLQLHRGGRACVLQEEPRALRAAPGTVIFEWSLRCPERGLYRMQSSLLLDVSPSHLHFARAKVGEDAAAERVLSGRGPQWVFGVEGDASVAESGTDFLGYLWLGVEHIITGYDHLAFVFVLLLTGRTLWEVAKIVTGFTIAHSITLGLMVLGYVRPEIDPIEALIGLSIALVAAENLWHAAGRPAVIPRAFLVALVAMGGAAAAGFGNVSLLTLAGVSLFTFCYFRLFEQVRRPETLRWGIAVLFGLIHGFGFAAMLTEAGLPADRVVSALVGFNLGVEIGQLAAVALVWPILGWIRRRDIATHAAVVEYGSAIVLACGVFWLVSRTYAA